MKFIIASKNPVKINAVALAIKEHFPDQTISSFEVDSGVSAQPMTDEETRTGALNRARAVRALAKKQAIIEDDEQYLCIGLEGGVFHPSFIEDERELWSTVWAVALDEKGKTYFSNGARFPIPAFLSELILAGGEMGPSLGALLENPDLKKQEGMIGYITKNFTNRTKEYESIVKVAIGIWYGRDSILTKKISKAK